MQNKFTYALMAAFSICSLSHSIAQQAPVLNWSKNYGGSNVDAATAIHQLADGSIVFAGYTNSNDNQVSGNHGGYDFWLVKLSSTGNLLWQKCYGGSGDEKAFDMQVTQSGGFVLTGFTSTNNNGDVTGNHGNSDVWLVVTDANGTLVHENCLGGSGGESATAVAEDQNGNFLLAAHTTSVDGDVSEVLIGDQDAWLIKVDATLTKLWDHCVGDTYNDAGADVFQKKNGTYAFLVSDECCSGSGNVMGVYTLSTEGATLGAHSYFAAQNFSYPVSLIEKPDGHLFGGGWHSDFEQFDFAAFESDSNGSTVWAHIYEIEDNNDYYDERGGNIGLLSDGNYLLAGYGGSKSNGILLLLDQVGNIQFTNNYGGSGNDLFEDMEVESNDAIFIAGNTLSDDGDLSQNYGSNDAWILKFQAYPDIACPVTTGLKTTKITSSSAKISWNAEAEAIIYKYRYKETNGSWTKGSTADTSKKIKNLTTNTEYVWQVKNQCGSNPNVFSDWSAKQHFNTALRLGANEKDEAALQIYPNPVSDLATISFSLSAFSPVKIELFDLQGRKIKTIAEGNFTEGDHTLNLSTEALPKGIYLLQLNTDSGILNRKLIIQ